MAWKSLTLNLADSSEAGSFEFHLLNLGAVAVTYTDAGDEPILEPELNTQPLWSDTNLNALFELDIDLEIIKISLINQFGTDTFKVIDETQVEDKAWEREWLEHFKPLRFGRRLWICPDKMQIPQDQQSSDDVIVDMDPGLAFGTGTHETTALCLNWLDGAELTNKTVLDYGAGSGILAIAALKLGAKNATCIDIDIQAIQACADNAQRNNLSDSLDAYLPDDPHWPAEETYDVLLANILASPLMSLVQDLRQRVRPKGRIVLSGILEDQCEQLQAIYEPYFELEKPLIKGGWVCLTGQLKESANLSRETESALDNEIIDDKTDSKLDDKDETELGGDVTVDLDSEDDTVTHCPNCNEKFYISASDLKRAKGKVRCGECNTVFSAVDFIQDTPKNEPANLFNTNDTGIRENPHLMTGLWDLSEINLSDDKPAAKKPDPAILEPVKDDKPELDLEIGTETGLETGPRLDTGPAPEIDFGLDPNLDPNHDPSLGTDFGTGIDADIDKAFESAFDTTFDTGDETEVTLETDSEIGTDIGESIVDDPDTDTDTEINLESAIEIAAESDSKRHPELINEDTQMPLTEEEPAPDNVEPLNMEELAALQKPVKPKGNPLWIVLALIALAGLGFQYLHQHRNQLALHPSLGEPVQTMYQKLGWNIEPDWNLNGYQINASSVSLNPKNKNELIVSFNLSNIANHAQTFPIIRLSLFNLWNERIAYRDLTKDDYVPQVDAESDRNTLLQARQRINVHVPFVDPGAEAMDFEVKICLEKSGIIRCQK